MGACAIVICLRPVPSRSEAGVSSTPSCSMASAFRSSALRPPRCAANIVSNASPVTSTPCRDSTVIPALALCATFGTAAFSSSGLTASSTSPSPSCLPSTWPTGTYHPSPGALANASPTRSAAIGSADDVCTSKANPAGVSNASIIAPSAVIVSTTWHSASSASWENSSSCTAAPAPSCGSGIRGTMLKNSRSRSASTIPERSYRQKRDASKSNSRGTSLTMVASIFDRSATCSFCRRLSRILGGLTSSRLLKMPSTEPWSSSSLVAVLAPIPGTPGMLSEVSPCSALMSGTASGPRPPYRSRTPASSYVFCFCTLYASSTRTHGETS